MSNNILDPSALLSKLPSLLPTGKRELKSPQDGLAALVHTALSILGFRLVGVDDSATISTFENNVLPFEWNSHGPGAYTFRYKHEQSSFEFLLKISKLGGRTMINAIAIETDKAASLDIATNDFLSPSFYPHTLDARTLTDFVSQLQMMVIQKLIPGLRKDGYVEQATDQTIHALCLVLPPPEAPDLISPPQAPPRNPLEIGRRDRLPFSGNPFAPPPLFGGDDGGMFVGPNHPIFNPRPTGQGRGPWGGDGFLPPMGAPPGARFDPVGPGLGPHPGGGNMRDPDNDEFMPPGYGDMFS
ncbi:PI31 proteasome regulator N-terminal-domain-containing protein [Irpex lacteus]|nr:PI31 proteasome regulator N-terminal-domain-containing protein [Irpex lacteus]